MFTTRPELTGTFGMVASTHWLASSAGMAVLERGGNAADAAVAAGFVLQVVEPHLNGPGGEVPILVRPADSGRVTVVCGQGPAPKAATVAAFRDRGLDLIPGTGLLAACVPGAFDAWMLLLRDFGTWRVGDVLRFAVGYAEGGFPLVAGISGAIAAVEQRFVDEWPSSAAVWLRDGVPAAGTRFRNPDLARTYQRVVDEAEAASADRDGQIEAARDAFYRGFVAEAITSWLTGPEPLDGTGRPDDGLLVPDDLASYHATAEEPVSARFRGWLVHKPPPWSQGPVFLQQLSLLDGFDLENLDAVEWVHVIVECAKLAFADREAFYGDPEHADVPLGDLLDATYAAGRRRLVADHASHDLRPGSPGGRAPRLPPAPRGGTVAPPRGGGDPTLGDTCHVDVVDRWGNAVSATPSGGWLQSSPVVDGLGFCLGTRAQMFWLDPDHPNGLAPGKRPRTTLTPSLAVREDGTVLAFGTPGGDQQDQWSLGFFLEHVVRARNLQEAIDAPAFHTEHLVSSFHPRGTRLNSVVVEERLGEPAVAGLRARGHDVVVVGPWSLGRVSAAAHDPRAGLLRAAANARGMQGYAVGR